MRDVARALLHALDPAAFARDRLGFDPDPWQADLLRSSGKWGLVLCSRQAGKSTTAALLALHAALFRQNALILLVSPSLRQSAELFKKTVDFRRRLDPAPDLAQDNTLSCTFAVTGSRIVSLPGDEATIRGYSAPALVVVDEAARVGDDLHRALRPMLATTPTGRFLALTTPAGQRGWFYEAWSSGNEEWQRISVTADQVPRISAEFLTAERRSLGETWFRVEYGCEFLASGDAVFSPADIARMLATDAQPLFPGIAAGEPLPLLFGDP